MNQVNRVYNGLDLLTQGYVEHDVAVSSSPSVSYSYSLLEGHWPEHYAQNMTRLYYSTGWQAIAEYQETFYVDNDEIVSDGAELKYEYVWSPVYIDAMVLRDDIGGGGARLYVTHDANFNVTGLVNTSGTVLERFEEDAYGTVTFLDPNWTVDAGGSDYDWVYLDQGSRFDAVTGLYHRRFRDVSATLGRPLQADPIGYPDGMSRYEWERSNPIRHLDPLGLFLGTLPAIGGVVAGGGAAAGTAPIWVPIVIIGGTVIGVGAVIYYYPPTPSGGYNPATGPTGLGQSPGVGQITFPVELPHPFPDLTGVGVVRYGPVNCDDKDDKDDDRRKCRQQCHEDYDTEERYCMSIQNPIERTRCLKNLAVELEFCIRRCNGSWPAPTPPGRQY